MSRIPFDRDAVKIFPHQAVKLLKKVGFEIKLIHYMFIFPGSSKIFRPIEKLASGYRLDVNISFSPKRIELRT